MLYAPDMSAARLATQAVQLTDAWPELLGNTLASVVQLGAVFAAVGHGSGVERGSIFHPQFPASNLRAQDIGAEPQIVLRHMSTPGMLFHSGFPAKELKPTNPRRRRPTRE